MVRLVGDGALVGPDHSGTFEKLQATIRAGLCQGEGDRRERTLHRGIKTNGEVLAVGKEAKEMWPHARKYRNHPRIVIDVPSEITQVERRAVIDSTYEPKPAKCIWWNRP